MEARHLRTRKQINYFPDRKRRVALKDLQANVGPHRVSNEHKGNVRGACAEEGNFVLDLLLQTKDWRGARTVSDVSYRYHCVRAAVKLKELVHKLVVKVHQAGIAWDDDEPQLAVLGRAA